METQPNLKISIPKPCHEDWNKFTPDEKGAFCKVCSKSVHDFTKKTVEEINLILVEEISAGKKVCGRFNEDQLTAATPAQKQEAQEELQESLYSLNFRRAKRFAMALFLVFGGYLFSTPKAYAQKMGKVAYIPKPEPIKGEISPRYVEPVEPVNIPVPVEDTVKIQTPKVPKINKCSPLMLKGDVAVEPVQKFQVMGGVSAVREPEPVVTTIGQAVIQEAPEKLVIKFTPPEVVEDTLVDEALPEPEILFEENLIMGLVAMPQIDEEPPVLIDPFPSDSIDHFICGEFAIEESTEVEKETPLEPEFKKAEEFTLPEHALEINVPKMECYPNPSTGFINVKYNVKENAQTSIVLYDMNGNVVKTLVAPQNMYAADYSTRFDISELEDGIYFCTMLSGDKIATQKIILGR